MTPEAVILKLQKFKKETDRGMYSLVSSEAATGSKEMIASRAFVTSLTSVSLDMRLEDTH